METLWYRIASRYVKYDLGSRGEIVKGYIDLGIIAAYTPCRRLIGNGYFR